MGEDNMCRATIIGETGIEWICIREKHADLHKEYRDEAEPADQHFYVNRWPNRESLDGEGKT